jgi:hypothetical protein
MAVRWKSVNRFTIEELYGRGSASILSGPNQALHLTGAAMLVSRGSMSHQAAPAGELGCSASRSQVSLFGGQEWSCYMFAVLEFWDFFLIWCIASLAYAGGRAAYARFQPSDLVRFRRLEAKVDLILRHLGLEYKDPATPGELSEAVKALADDSRKIEAIKMLREQTGLGLKEAKDAVETYMAGRS